VRDFQKAEEYARVDDRERDDLHDQRVIAKHRIDELEGSLAASQAEKHAQVAMFTDLVQERQAALTVAEADLADAPTYSAKHHVIDYR